LADQQTTVEGEGDTYCGQGKTTENLIFGLYTDHSRGYDLQRVTLAVAKVRPLRF